MIYTKTWTFAYNTTPENQSTATLQAASFWRQLKDFLVAGGWTVAQSCDSTQVQNADTWDALSKLVWAASGAHSWLVLKSPEGIVAGLDGSYTGDQSRVWLSVDLAVTSALVYTATFRLHRVTPTGGTTSAAPTSATQVSYTNQQFLRNALNTNGRFHFARTSEGHFFAMTGYAGAGYTPFFFGILPMKNVLKHPVTGLDYPFALPLYAGWVDGVINNGTQQGALALGKLNAQNITVQYGIWQLNNIPGWTFTGAAGTHTASTFCIPYYPNPAGSTYGLLHAMANAFSGLGDDWTGNQILMPVLLACTTTNGTALIGELADFYLGGQNCPQGSVDSVDITATMLGSAWLPCNVSPAL